MTPTDVKRLAKSKIDGLSPMRARVALDFLDYLDSREEDDATEELLAIPGLVKEIRDADARIAKGEFVEWKDLRQKRKSTRQGRGVSVSRRS